MRRWVIACEWSLLDLYWSNDWGWTSIEEATIFDDDEKPQLALPAGGYWVEYEN